MGLFDNEDEESNDDFMKRLNAQLDSQGPEIDPDSDPLPIEQVVAEAPSVAAPQEPVSAPVVGKSFSMPASDIVRPRPEDVVNQRIADLARQKIEQSKKREGLVQEVQDADSSVINSILSAISGFGAGIAGRDAGAAFDSARKIGTSKANRALSEFDKQIEEDRRSRADESEVRAEGRLEKADSRLDKAEAAKAAELARLNDPNSDESQHAREYFRRLAPNTPPELLKRMTAAQVAKLSPNYEKIYEMDFKNKEFENKNRQRQEDVEWRKEVQNRTDARARTRDAAIAANAGATRAVGAYNASRLPPPVLETLQGIDEFQGGLGLIAERAGLQPGPIVGKIPQELRRWVLDTNSTIVQQHLGFTLGSFIKSQSGLSTTEGERKFLEDLMPKPDDTNQMLLDKLQGAQEFADTKQKSMLKTYGKAGYDTSPFANNPEQQQTAQSAGAQSRPYPVDSSGKPRGNEPKGEYRFNRDRTKSQKLINGQWVDGKLVNGEWVYGK